MKKNAFLSLALLIAHAGNAQTLSYHLGDANGDGHVTVADVATLNSVLQGQTTPAYWQESDGLPGIGLGDVEATARIAIGKDASTVIDGRRHYAHYTIDVPAGQRPGQQARVQQAVCYVDQQTLPTDDFPLTQHLTRISVHTSLKNVVSVSAYAEDHAAIAGPMTITTRGNDAPEHTYDSGQRVVYGSSQESDVVTLYADGDDTFDLHLRPIPLSHGILVTIRTSDGGFYSQHFDVQAGEENTLLFTQTVSQHLWMSTLPGGTWLSMLSIPGAHDAATKSVSGFGASMARCQALTIPELLAQGVRAFDLRPRYNSYKESDITLDNLTIYHGIMSTGIRFVDAIDALVDFVRQHPSETVSVLMQKESAIGNDYSETWRTSIRQCFNDPARRPYLLDALQGDTRLDDVRGKVCVVSRTPYGAGGYYTDIVGAIFNGWADNTSVTDYSGRLYVNGNRVTCTANLQDVYDTNTTDKKAAFDAMLGYSSSNTNPSRHHYNYTSIASKAFGASIADNATTMNPYAANAIKQSMGPAGYVYGDYMGSASHSGDILVQTIIAHNHSYTYTGMMAE